MGQRRLVIHIILGFPPRVPLVLEIVTGPDQGKRFPIDGDLLHVGRGDDNSIVLVDPQLGDFHVSIAQHEGQLSFYANESNQVRVANSLIPGQQWVTIPPQASIHLGGQTEARFVEDSSTTSPATPTRRHAPRKESKRQVARPVTTRSIAPVVQLGSDGKFPELNLAAGAAPRAVPQQQKGTNPALLFTILAASCLCTAGLLLIDLEPAGVTSSRTQAEARSDLAIFYGTDSAKLEPYQVLLRRAAVEYSQGNRSGERQLLKQVLALLNSVDTTNPENLNGLTGRQTGQGKASDKKLESLLMQILN